MRWPWKRVSHGFSMTDITGATYERWNPQCKSSGPISEEETDCEFGWYLPKASAETTLPTNLQWLDNQVNEMRVRL